MKKSLFFAMGLFSAVALAQTGRVGINVSKPNATLNVKSKNDAQSPKNLELENETGTKLVTVLNNGRVGIRNENPKYTLDVEGSSKSIQFHSFSIHSDTSSHPAVINLSSKGGNINNPNFVANNNVLGAFISRDAKSHYDADKTSSNLYGGSEIYAYATENFTATAKGSNLTFSTTANGTATSKPRMVIEDDGSIRIIAREITPSATCKIGSIAYGVDGNFYACKGGSWKTIPLLD